jgi:membrane associated rhomboid family serine protease
MLLLPYRSKNPPESFPYATIALIVLNVAVYVFTTQSLLVVKESTVETLAMSHNTLWKESWRIITAMFLHGSLVHLIGNLLMLGVFGPGAEGRLRTVKFICLYFVAGIVGGLFDDLVSGFGAPERFSLGASGAIMGVVGMYLYMFPHTKVMVLFGLKRLEWKASWIIGFYIFYDLWYGFTQLHDGVGHLCHLGGLAVGIVGTMLLGAKHDTASESRVSEMRTEAGGNLHSLALPELAFAYAACPDDAEITMAYVMRASREGSRRKIVEVMQEREAQLVAANDREVEELGFIIVGLTEYDGVVPPWLSVRIAGRLEKINPGIGETLCRRVLRTRPYPNGELLEQTLVRLAAILDQNEKMRGEAALVYKEIVDRFPFGAWTAQSTNRLKELEMPKDLYFAVQEGKAMKREVAPASSRPFRRA